MKLISLFFIMALMFVGCGKKASDVCLEYGYADAKYGGFLGNNREAGFHKMCFGEKENGLDRVYFLTEDWKHIQKDGELLRRENMKEFVPREEK